MDGFSGREIWEGELVLEPGGSDRTVAQDVVLATGQAALAMINGSMIDQSLKNDERWING